MKTVGQLIHERREALGLTLAVLAQEVDTAKSYLSMIENHRVANPPSKQLLQRLERALRLETGELMRLAEWEVTPAKVRAMMEDLREQAEKGKGLANALRQAAEKGDKGWRNLDKAFRDGELAKLIDETLEAAPADLNNLDATIPMRVRVPIINRVAAGYPTDFTDLDYPARVADDYISVPGLTDPQAFAARVVGDSMQPEYLENDIVVFSPEAKISSGVDCFVRLLPDYNSTFKRVFFDQAGEAATSANQDSESATSATVMSLPKQLRLQPINPRYAPQMVEREQVAGLYKAVFRFQKLGRM